MIKFARKIGGSLTGRLTILFILVHFATVIGFGFYQTYKFKKEVQDEGFPPLALFYALEDLRLEYPDFDVTKKIRPSPAAPNKFTAWYDILEKNPKLWFYYAKDGSVIQYGRLPVLIPDVTFDEDLKHPHEDLCKSTALQSVEGGYDVIAGFGGCNFDSVVYEIGGVDPNYTRTRNFDLINALRDELRFGPVLFSYFGLILLMPLLIYWFVSPIRRASRAALNISPYSKRKLLPVDGMLSEVRGLADATNQALKRLDAGYVRERWLRDVIAHEMRTPLMVLRGYVEDVSDTDVRENLTESVKRANSILKRLMEFSAATSLADSPQTLGLTKVVRAACAENGAFARRENIELNLISELSNDVFVSANRVAVMLILTNLLNNAVRHSGTDRAIDIEIFSHGEVQIRDYGSGMDITALNQFFHKFATFDDRLSKRKGLGLIIVAELTEFCGGEISAFQTQGGGTGFSLRLPILSRQTLQQLRR